MDNRSTSDLSAAGSGWPVLAWMNDVFVCRYMGGHRKGEPVERFRIQLMSRPGHPFLFLDAAEWEGLVGICKGMTGMEGYDTGQLPEDT